jgi:amidase
MFFDEGIERAKFLDAELARTGKPIGPLHGLPISLKDTFRYAGYDATGGIVGAANDPVDEHEPFVKLLLDAGAVLYCKTNIPQSLMTADSQNHLYGRTLNPLNIKLTAGGSSGGEGSLICFGGSVLGFGTDIAGSIRIPSWAHGGYSLKPTTARVPYYGSSSLHGSGIFGIYPVAGPLATSSRSVNSKHPVNFVVYNFGEAILTSCSGHGSYHGSQALGNRFHMLA